MRPVFTFGPVTEADFEALLLLRLATMRDSLERLGRFDAVRARERFRSTFRPQYTRRIGVGVGMGMGMGIDIRCTWTSAQAWVARQRAAWQPGPRPA